MHGLGGPKRKHPQPSSEDCRRESRGLDASIPSVSFEHAPALPQPPSPSLNEPAASTAKGRTRVTFLRRKAMDSLPSILDTAAPPLPGPETWIAEVDAKIRLLDDEAKERVLLDFLMALADFLREEMELETVIAQLGMDLEDLMGTLTSPLTPPEHRDQLRSAIAVVERMIDRYKGLRSGLRRP